MRTRCSCGVRKVVTGLFESFTERVRYRIDLENSRFRRSCQSLVTAVQCAADQVSDFVPLSEARIGQLSVLHVVAGRPCARNDWKSACSSV